MSKTRIGLLSETGIGRLASSRRPKSETGIGLLISFGRHIGAESFSSANNLGAMTAQGSEWNGDMIKDAIPPAPRRRQPSGMTLLELLTVIFLGLLLLSMVFMLYSNSSRSYARQGDIMEQALNLRGGLANLSRQIRMAGNGYTLLGRNQDSFIQVYLKDENGAPLEWFKYPGFAKSGIRPIWSGDGGLDGPDSITICALAPDFATPLGVLATEFRPSNGRLDLDSVLEIPAGLPVSEVLKPGDWLALVPATGDPILVESDDDGSNLSRIKIKPMPSSLPNGIAGIASGSAVFNVKTLTLRTYSIDPATRSLLMTSDMVAGDLMAENIEDLQVAYCLAPNDPGVLSSYLDKLDAQDLSEHPVKAVRLFMVSRSARPDPYRNTYQPVTAYNRTVVGPPDGHIRRFLENTVQLRNY